MLMDAQARPSLAQTLALAAGTVVSTDSIDLLTAVDNPGRGGQPMRAIATVSTALASGTSVQAQLISSASSNLSSPTVLATGPVVLDAAATAGAVLLDVPLPDVAQRYLGFQYILVGGPHTTGAVTAGIVGGTDRNATTIPMNLG